MTPNGVTTASVECSKVQVIHSKISPVSTDSALSSDDAFPNPPNSVNGVSLHLKDNNKKNFDAEAQLLLCYIKSHRSVLNYLGIGLADSLWIKVDEMPNYKVELRIVDENKEKMKDTVREKILHRKSSNSKSPKQRPTKKAKEISKVKIQTATPQEPSLTANNVLIKAPRKMQYRQPRDDSSDEEHVRAAEEEPRGTLNCVSEDDQQIIQDFEDVSKQVIVTLSFSPFHSLSAYIKAIIKGENFCLKAQIFCYTF